MSYVNYFAECTTVEEIKTLYRTLAKQYHPDRNPGKDTTRIMQDINAQYHAALKGKHQSTSRDTTGQEHTYYYNEDHEQAIIDKIKEVLKVKFPDYVEFWLVGKWLWIDGTRKEDAEARADLNRLDFKWHSKREMWYWKPTNSRRSRYSQKASFDDLAEKYGKTAAAQAV